MCSTACVRADSPPTPVRRASPFKVGEAGGGSLGEVAQPRGRGRPHQTSKESRVVKSKIRLERRRNDDVAYLYLPAHAGKGAPGSVAKHISLSSMIENYRGPEVLLDFDKDGELVGLEFLRVSETLVD